MVAVPKPRFLGSRLWCWNLASKGPKNQQGLEELFWNLEIASSRVAPVQDVFLRQAKLPLHGGWRRTWEVCHWPWHVKSIIKTQDKASSIIPDTKLDRLGTPELAMVWGLCMKTESLKDLYPSLRALPKYFEGKLYRCLQAFPPDKTFKCWRL